jgi:hypothetical protein
MMNDIRQQDLNAQDRAHSDNKWQEDMAWLEMSGAIPERVKPRGEGLMKSFEKHPLLWSLVVLAMGGFAFILLTVFMY